MRKIAEFFNSTGWIRFCLYMGIFFMVFDALSRRWGGVAIWAVITVLNWNTYKRRMAENPPKLDKSSCPPHLWDVQDGFIHCTKCGEDLREKK